MTEKMINEIKEAKVIAIVRGAEASRCHDIVEALYQGGIRFVEITYDQLKPESWKETAETIGKLVQAFKGKVHIGAGTVTNVELVEMTYENNGEYVISPDTNIDVIKRTKELGMVSMPGALTPTEIKQAYDAGADFVKLFPASEFGTEYVKAIRAPLSNIPLLAVGGINEDNIADYLKAGCLGAGVGGNLAKKEWIEAGEYEKLTEAAEAILAAVK
jgi:2-dehydro-3-deoxyphosphogluconate aldolase/(4S)-4-hydroxy-2-oxoglutarate aldolase